MLEKLSNGAGLNLLNWLVKNLNPNLLLKKPVEPLSPATA
jgi:hypothetical protein